MKCLFVGGNRDGRFIDVDEFHRIVCFPVIQPISIINMEEHETISDTDLMEKEIYVRQYFRVNFKRFTIYALEKITPNEIIEKLIMNNKNALKNVVFVFLVIAFISMFIDKDLVIFFLWLTVFIDSIEEIISD